MSTQKIIALASTLSNNEVRIKELQDQIAKIKLENEEVYNEMCTLADGKDQYLGVNPENGKHMKFAMRTKPGYNPETRKQGAVRKMRFFETDRV